QAEFNTQMATVERIETFLVDLPTIRPHQLAMTTMHGQTLMLVQIHCSDGTVGIGEGTTIGGLAYSEESPESMKLTVDTYIAVFFKLVVTIYLLKLLTFPLHLSLDSEWWQQLACSL